MEKRHPNLKILLILFLAVFLVLIGLAGLKMYHDIGKPVPDMVGSGGQGDRSGRMSEEALRKQLADMDRSDDANKRLSQEELEKQVDAFDKAGDTGGRMTADELEQQVEAFDKQ